MIKMAKIQNRYFNNEEEFVKQLTMEEVVWENETKDGYDSNGEPCTLERLLFILDNYIDDNHQPVYYPMDRGLILCYLTSVLAKYTFNNNEIKTLTEKICNSSTK